jgi:hypothetical protein
MSFDAWIVGFGLSALLKELQLVTTNWAYLLLLGVAVLDTCLLYRFFTVQLPRVKRMEALGVEPEPAAAPAPVAGYDPAAAPVRSRTIEDALVAPLLPTLQFPGRGRPSLLPLRVLLLEDPEVPAAAIRQFG